MLILVVISTVSDVRGNDWRRIFVPKQNVVPSHVDIFEKTPITVYCGSSTPADWTYYLVHNNYEPIAERHKKGYNKVTLVDILLNDTGFYQCHGSFKRHYFEDTLFVHVVQNNWFDFDNLVVPSWLEVPENSDVKLSCGSLRPVDWFSNQFANLNKIYQGNTLILHNLKREHSGLYYCRGINYMKRVFLAKATIIVDGYVDWEAGINYLPRTITIM